MPIIKTTKQEVLETIQHASDYDLYEIWLDYVDDYDEQFINDMIKQYSDKLILLFRRQKLETPHMPLEKRLAIIKHVNEKKLFVDLDISQKEELEFVKKECQSLQLIASYHNYEETPDEQTLNSIVTSLEEYNPTIVKLATMCNNAKDTLRLLDVLLALKEKQTKFIVLGMGEHGLLTRIFGALWGNEITFAPNDKTESSAPGQLTKQEMETILKILNTN